MNLCVCLAQSKPTHLCYTCKGVTLCPVCRPSHQKHRILAIQTINNQTKHLNQTIQRQQQIYQKSITDYNKQNKIQAIQQISNAYLHYKGVLFDIRQLQQISKKIRSDNLSIGDCYQYMRLMQFLFNQNKIQAADLLIDSQTIIFTKKLQAIFTKYNEGKQQIKVQFNQKQRKALKTYQQYLKFKGRVKVPPKSKCRKCTIKICARYRVCVLCCKHYFTCRFMQCHFCMAIRQHGCDINRLQQFLCCLPCILCGLCHYRQYYCQNPLLLCCLCNSDCQCRVCDLNEHPCPCCLCCARCCGQNCQCQCCDEFCQCYWCDSCCQAIFFAICCCGLMQCICNFCQNFCCDQQSCDNCCNQVCQNMCYILCCCGYMQKCCEACCNCCDIFCRACDSCCERCGDCCQKCCNQCCQALQKPCCWLCYCCGGNQCCCDIFCRACDSCCERCGDCCQKCCNQCCQALQKPCCWLCYCCGGNQCCCDLFCRACENCCGRCGDSCQKCCDLCLQ